MNVFFTMLGVTGVTGVTAKTLNLNFFFINLKIENEIFEKIIFFILVKGFFCHSCHKDYI